MTLVYGAKDEKQKSSGRIERISREEYRWMKIGIVGGGPRGLSMAERLLRNGANEQALELILFDPVGPGAKSGDLINLLNY